MRTDYIGEQGGTRFLRPGQRYAHGIEYAHFRPIDGIRRQVCVPEFRHPAPVLAREPVGGRFLFFGLFCLDVGPCGWIGASHSARMPSSRIRRRHLAISLRMCSPNCAEVLPTGSEPSAVRCPRISGVRRIRTIARFSFSTIAGGVAAGAIRPYQPETSYPGTPASCIVGMSGCDAERLGPVTASARSRPETMWPRDSR